MIAIPKTGNRGRLRENADALTIRLTESQIAELDHLFPAPQGAIPLEML
jgi:diketogulonate reductase-like aldo/keto reductase